MADSHSQNGLLQQALEALKTYDRGASRALLLPIDEAVRAALTDAKAKADIEAQLVRALQTASSTVAREYVCSKLALVGARAAVPELARLLKDPQLCTAARNALECNPDSAAGKALRAALRNAPGLLKVGIINSLGVRRDDGALGALKVCLREGDEQTAAAARAALAEIGSVKASEALRNHFLETPEVVRRKIADAILVCAKRLSEEGSQAKADALLKLLLAPGLPSYIQRAAERALSHRSPSGQ